MDPLVSFSNPLGTNVASSLSTLECARANSVAQNAEVDSSVVDFDNACTAAGNPPIKSRRPTRARLGLARPKSKPIIESFFFVKNKGVSVNRVVIFSCLVSALVTSLIVYLVFTATLRSPPEVDIYVDKPIPFWPIDPPDDGAGHWAYAQHGTDWNTIKVNGIQSYPMCDGARVGAQQSPIDLPAVPDMDSAMATAPLIFNYAKVLPFSITERPNGHPGFQLRPTDVSTKDINFTSPSDGRIFTFSQFHFHNPAEHTIAGAEYPFELHMVHTLVGDPSKVAIISILFNNSNEHNSDFDSFFWDIVFTRDNINGVKLNDIMSHVHPTYWTYPGSFTTPPCNEDVTWFVFIATTGINPLQHISYQYALSGIENYRDTQPLDSRMIKNFRLR